MAPIIRYWMIAAPCHPAIKSQDLARASTVSLIFLQAIGRLRVADGR
ncbi:hypothetical protein [Rhodoblastus sp.]|nr:hypothetical protein [Rhodoblastus sp.]